MGCMLVFHVLYIFMCCLIGVTKNNNDDDDVDKGLAVAEKRRDVSCYLEMFNPQKPTKID